MKDKLLDLIKNSYAPYSGLHFACIVEDCNGNFYEGVNIENASFGATICAERNAINSAVSHGVKKFACLYLMGDSDELCYPCNLCKQTFLEFFDEKVIFNVMNKLGEMKVLTFDEIMNCSFTKKDLL